MLGATFWSTLLLIHIHEAAPIIPVTFGLILVEKDFHSSSGIHYYPNPLSEVLLNMLTLLSCIWIHRLSSECYRVAC